MYLWSIENHWLYCATSSHNHLSCPRLCGGAFSASESSEAAETHVGVVWPQVALRHLADV
jgi:hypothetical protein